MATNYYRLLREIKNPFHDRRAAHGIEQFESIPNKALIQFNYIPEKLEIDGKVQHYERLHSVYWIANDYRKFSIDQSTYKKGSVNFWDVLLNASEQSQPDTNSEFHFACDEPAIDFYIQLLRSNGYTFEQLKSLHDKYADEHYE